MLLKNASISEHRLMLQQGIALVSLFCNDSAVVDYEHELTLPLFISTDENILVKGVEGYFAYAASSGVNSRIYRKFFFQKYASLRFSN